MKIVLSRIQQQLEDENTESLQSIIVDSPSAMLVDADSNMEIDKVKAKHALPMNLARRLVPLIARDKAKLLWHSNAKFENPKSSMCNKIWLSSMVGFAAPRSFGSAP
jgi:hypothetical protein